MATILLLFPAGDSSIYVHSYSYMYIEPPNIAALVAMIEFDHVPPLPPLPSLLWAVGANQYIIGFIWWAYMMSCRQTAKHWWSLLLICLQIPGYHVPTCIIPRPSEPQISRWMQLMSYSKYNYSHYCIGCHISPTISCRCHGTMLS